MDLNRLNCMNYQVTDSEGDFWFAQNGLRSIYEYAIRSDKTFREFCTELDNKGEISFKYHIVADKLDINNPELLLTELTLTMI